MSEALRSPKYRLHTWAILISLGVPWSSAFGQCEPTVPSFIVDLTASPAATYLSPVVQRLDHCCGATDPDQCIEFIVTLHPAAQGIVFNICSGAMPSGAMFYQLDCGSPTAVGTALCLNGPGPHFITFCKPGNNNNQYCITSIPEPSAGPDAIVNDGCSALLTTTGFAQGTTIWTSISPGTPGAYDAFLSCPTCANTLVTGGAGYQGVVDYLVCGNAVSPCSSTLYCDTVRVHFNPTLTATVMPLQPTICFGATSTTITAIGSGGSPPYSFLWNTGETTAMILAGPGNYSVQISDATICPPTTATVTVTAFNQPIQALAGADITVCGGGPAQLNASVTGASGGIWTSGSGQFQPSSTALDATYTPSPAELAAGSVTLVLETTGNGTCPGHNDTLVVSFPPGFPSMSVAATEATCQGSDDGQAAVTPAVSGYTYSWTGPGAQTSPVATGLGAGAYSVTITDQAGCTTTLTTVVGEPLAITITDVVITNETCAGNGDGSISVSASGGTGPYSYVWSNGSTTSSIAVGAGTYMVGLSDANECTPATATATVFATGQPNIAAAGADQIVCMNDYPIPLNGSVQNATSGAWSGGNGTFSGSGLTVSYTPSAAEIASGGVDLTLTTVGNSACPAASDVVHIALPNIFLNAALYHTDVLCAGENTGTATFSPSLPSLTYQWNPTGQTTATALALPSGSHTITVTDPYGCDTTMSVSIAAPPPLVTNVQMTDPSCAGYSNGSATAMPFGGTPGYSFQWSANAAAQTTATASNLSSGIFIVTVTDANGCTAQASTSLTAPPPIQLAAQVPDTICVNAPVQLAAQASGGNGNLLINWAGIGSGTSLIYSFPSSQTVVVTVSDGAGCQGPTFTFPVHVMDLATATMVTEGDTTVCPGGSALVSAQVIGYTGSVSYAWSELQVAGPGPHAVPVGNTQILHVSASNSCGQVLTGTVMLTLETPPLIELPNLIAQGCAPLTVQFPDSLTDQTVTWLWHLGDGSTSTAMAPLHTYTAGSYVIALTVTTSAGCSAQALNTSSVLAFPPPVAGFTASTYSSDMDAPTITFTDNSAGDINEYTWDFGDGGTSSNDSPTHTYADVGTFTVDLTVTDVNGCTDMTSAMIQMRPIYSIVIPNAFTPGSNGGGSGYYDPTDLGNDIFYPFVDYLRDFRMRIWNRWGELVFESDEITRGWDGWYKGHLSQQDVYVYHCWFRFVDGFQTERTGDLTLFR